MALFLNQFKFYCVMQKVIVMCGFPRCGKTTYTKEQLQDYIRVSFDDIAEMMTGKFKIEYAKLYEEIEKLIIDKLIAKKLNIVIDRTSLTRNSRKQIRNAAINAAKKANLPAPFLTLTVVQSPLDICTQRNIQTQKVPPGIFRKMIKSYEEPTHDEGWDEIKFISL